MAPRPAGLRFLPDTGRKYQKIPQRDVRGFVGTDTAPLPVLLINLSIMKLERCYL
jgi:hypothetical protein